MKQVIILLIILPVLTGSAQMVIGPGSTVKVNGTMVVNGAVDNRSNSSELIAADISLTGADQSLSTVSPVILNSLSIDGGGTKTIQGTWAQFLERLPLLLNRFHFQKEFIENEMKEMNGYVVSRTNSKSILAFMNQMVPTLEHHFYHAGSYDEIPQQWLEDLMMKFPHKHKGSHEYFSPLQFWEETIKPK